MCLGNTNSRSKPGRPAAGRFATPETAALDPRAEGEAAQ
jgi:hypothetical protein